MNADLLDSLDRVGVAFDTETWLITDRCAAPPVVCGSFLDRSGVATVHGGDDDGKAELRRRFLELLEPGVVVIGAYLAFDMTVMATDFARRGINLWPQIFAKYDRGEIYDVLLAEMLDAIGIGCLGLDPRTGGGLRDPGKNFKATNRYSLAVVTDLVLDRVDAKDNDYWRMRYALLDGVPIDSWPEEARTYPLDDVTNPLQVALAQVAITPRGDGSTRRAMNLHMLAEMSRASFALALGAAWGFATDPDMVDALEAETKKNIVASIHQFMAEGLIAEKKDGKLELEVDGEIIKLSKKQAPLRRLVALAYGATDPCQGCHGTGKAQSEKTGKPITCSRCAGTSLDLNVPSVPRTEKGGVMTARDILVDSGSDLLVDYGDWGEDLKTVSTYIPGLRRGVPLYPNVPLANERVSYSGIVQTMPRKASAHGDISVRECIVARPGMVLASVDFSGVEMVTWAQVCINLLGYSTLGDAINSGADAHSILGADLCGRTYEEFIPLKKTDLKDYRQAAKWGNFGYAGGMGPPKFVITNRKAPGMYTKAPDGKPYKGVRFCLLTGGKQRCGEERIVEWKGRPTGSPVCLACVEEAVKIRQAWFNRWLEAGPYFEYISKQVEDVGSITHFGSGIVRGGVGFCQAANGYFSALAAYGAKRAYWAIVRECYTDTRSSLYNCRPIAFIHDEAVVEMPETQSHEAAHRMVDVMVAVMQDCCPDVRVSAEPALMRRLYKGAEPVYQNDRLIPWEPEEKAT
jgi:hypothetical protein